VPVPPAELTAEFTIEGPDEAVAAARAVADPSGLAREAGPGVTLLAGSRSEVMATLNEVVAATLGAGAQRVDVRLEAPTETR
jgi:uncharacterized protein YqgV (UPF0045/DUF77 family)